MWLGPTWFCAVFGERSLPKFFQGIGQHLCSAALKETVAFGSGWCVCAVIVDFCMFWTGICLSCKNIVECQVGDMPVASVTVSQCRPGYGRGWAVVVVGPAGMEAYHILFGL